MTDSKIRVLITVDTEHSIGGAFHNAELYPVGNEQRIYGRIGGRSYGIPLIMDIADQYDLKIVFFVEVLNKYFFGEGETNEICAYIKHRGHEVQLHLHPNYLNFKESNPQALKYKDNLHSYSMDRQAELISEGRALLHKYDIMNPIAFRAGNYGFNRDTLIALKHNGFIFDSSYNLSFLKLEHGLNGTLINDAQVIDGVCELPITNFIEHVPLLGVKPKPLDINGVSIGEMIHTLDWARSSRALNYITIILHSFSFIEPHDIQYSQMKPRYFVIKRFMNLCRYLSEHRDVFLVTGFNSLPAPAAERESSSPSFFHMPATSSIARIAQQAYHTLVK